MTKRALKKKFLGPLAKPINSKRHSLTILGEISGDRQQRVRERNAAEARRCALEAMGKMPLLLEHYGLPRKNDDGSENWFLLAFYLAVDLGVPGLQTVIEGRGPGQPRRHWQTLTRLVADVEAAKASNPGMSDRAAISALKKRGSSSARRWEKWQIGTLRNMLVDARDPNKNEMWAVTEHLESKGLSRAAFLDAIDGAASREL